MRKRTATSATEETRHTTAPASRKPYSTHRREKLSGENPMTYRELVYETDMTHQLPSFRAESNKNCWEILLDNNGPIMNLWFIAMLINIIGLIFLF